jgi:hypothetical protein
MSCERACPVVPEPQTPWSLDGFLDCFDRWADQEKPSEGVRFIVMEWILGRAENPYVGVRREPGFDNLWFGPIPRTQQPDGTVTACAYWIYETTRTVRCDSFATLETPL